MKTKRAVQCRYPPDGVGSSTRCVGVQSRWAPGNRRHRRTTDFDCHWLNFERRRAEFAPSSDGSGGGTSWVCIVPADEDADTKLLNTHFHSEWFLRLFIDCPWSKPSLKHVIITYVLHRKCRNLHCTFQSPSSIECTYNRVRSSFQLLRDT